MSAEEARVRVRSREGEELTCTRKAARRSSTLSNWIDNTADEGAFQAKAITVAVLRVILGFCEDDESSPLASHSVAELFAVMEGANWLDAPDAFAAARQFKGCSAVLLPHLLARARHRLCATRSLAPAGHEHLPGLIAPSGRVSEERAKVAESPRHQKPGPGGRFASAEAAHRKGHRRPGITQAQEQPGR